MGWFDNLSNTFSKNLDLGGYFSGKQGLIPDWGGVPTTESLGLDGQYVTDMYSQSEGSESILSGSGTGLGESMDAFANDTDNGLIDAIDVNQGDPYSDTATTLGKQNLFKAQVDTGDDFNPWEDEDDYGRSPEEAASDRKRLMETYGTTDLESIKKTNLKSYQEGYGDVGDYVADQKKNKRGDILKAFGQGLMGIAGDSFQYEAI
tara:strand:+ start:7634 stop:8248 length:615 start_codon:yes stop_codon:yes gene_type:complete